MTTNTKAVSFDFPTINPNDFLVAEVTNDHDRTSEAKEKMVVCRLIHAESGNTVGLAGVYYGITTHCINRLHLNRDGSLAISTSSCGGVMRAEWYQEKDECVVNGAIDKYNSVSLEGRGFISPRVLVPLTKDEEDQIPTILDAVRNLK